MGQKFSINNNKQLKKTEDFSNTFKKNDENSNLMNILNIYGCSCFTKRNYKVKIS